MEPRSYLGAVAGRLRTVLGDNLVGVYAGGSLALEAFDGVRSDVDLAAVVSRPLTRAAKEALVAAVRHEALPCPARGLELVVYTEEVARSGTAGAGWELDLDTGARMPFRAAFAPDGEAGHWYAIDRAVLAAHGRAVVGPPAADVFAPAARPVLLDALADSLRWYRAHPDEPADDAVLNACRAWRFADDGTWSSKPAAGAWALRRGIDGALVEAALSGRAGGPLPARADVERFLAAVEARLEDDAVRLSVRAGGLEPPRALRPNGT